MIYMIVLQNAGFPCQKLFYDKGNFAIANYYIIRVLIFQDILRILQPIKKNLLS